MRVLVVAAPLLGLPGPVVADTVTSAWASVTGRPDDIAAVVPGRGAGVPDEPVTTLDPWGRTVPAGLARSGDHVVVDTLAAAGPALRRDGDDPAEASSAGLGLVVRHAVVSGARTVVLPLEGLACHDAGAGLVGALAGRPEATPADLVVDDVMGARAALGGARLVGRYEDDGPLLGLQGASAVQGPERGMTPVQAQAVENGFGALVDRLRRALPEPTDLLTGAVVRRDRQPGAGAGGGLGHGILLLGGTLEQEAPAVARDAGLADAIARCDLVVTCTDRFDWRVLRSSLPQVCAALAAPSATPVVLVAGEGEAGRREAMSLGLSGLYEVVEEPRRRATLLADPVAALRRRVERVARTWEPTR